MQTAATGMEVFTTVFTSILSQFTGLMSTLFDEPLFLIVLVISVLFSLVALIKSVI